jgi:murein L,D-transpeptidase YcbB/YkuD
MGFKVLRNGREVNPRSVKWYKTDVRLYDIYQPPGPGNALGILKFTFPNKHAVYMHDTPNKDLFNSSERTFSHGCMRVRDPKRLAEVLLAIDKGWDKTHVDEMIDKEPTDIDNGVPLDKHIPVHVTYFTVWADEGGELNTREDVYGHEKRITLALQGKWAAIDKGKDHLAAIEPDDAPKPSYRSRKRGWSRSAAGGGWSGGGWSAPATRVSQGNSAHDIFRRGFGY